MKGGEEVQEEARIVDEFEFEEEDPNVSYG